ncbi:unnamed protein product, partial [Cuscuta europaea]
MDVNSLFALKKTKGKKKDPSGPKPVGASPIEEPSQAAAAGVGAGSSKGEGGLKKKNGGKGLEPPAKKLKAADSGKQPAADVVLIVDEGHASGPIPQERVYQDFFGREKLEAIVPKWASILEGNLIPSALMRQVMPSADRLALAQMNDEGLNSRILQNSASAFMGLCEHFRRVEQMMEARGAAEEEAASLRKKLAEAEDSLRLATESMEQRVRAAKAEGKSEGLAEAGEAAA